MVTNDIDIKQFAKMLQYLEPHPELTEELDQWGSVYSSEKAHMCLWFGGQATTGSGSYTRGKPNNSTRSAYNRLLCPGAMLWIAEVLGESPEQLKAACAAAIEAEKENVRARGKAFRDVISFDRIYELYMHPEAWIYDKLLLDYISQDNQGYPVQVKKNAIRKILKEEIV